MTSARALFLLALTHRVARAPPPPLPPNPHNTTTSELLPKVAAERGGAGQGEVQRPAH